MHGCFLCAARLWVKMTPQDPACWQSLPYSTTHLKDTLRRTPTCECNFKKSLQSSKFGETVSYSELLLRCTSDTYSPGVLMMEMNAASTEATAQMSALFLVVNQTQS